MAELKCCSGVTSLLLGTLAVPAAAPIYATTGSRSQAADRVLIASEYFVTQSSVAFASQRTLRRKESESLASAVCILRAQSAMPSSSAHDLRNESHILIYIHISTYPHEHRYYAKGFHMAAVTVTERRPYLCSLFPPTYSLHTLRRPHCQLMSLHRVRRSIDVSLNSGDVRNAYKAFQDPDIP